MRLKRRLINLGFCDERFLEGHHIIYVYRDDWEKKCTLTKFLQQGLLDGEKVLYLADDISREEMSKEFVHLGVEINLHPADFDLMEGHYTCCPNRYFSPEFMLQVVERYYHNAIEEGYRGARGAGEMSWALVEGRTNISDLLWYEAELNKRLQQHPLTTVCQYDANRFDGALIMDLLSVHPLMIVRGQLVKNPNYVKPEKFLREYYARSPKPIAKDQKNNGEST